MRKFYSLLILLGLFGANSAFAQSLTVTHYAEGNLQAEIEEALSGSEPSTFVSLKIICEDADLNYNPDLIYIKNNFTTTLTTLDLSEATFKDNVMPTGGNDYGTVGAFTGMTGLTTVVLPEDLVTLGAATFSGCTNLKTINLPNTLTRIQSDAFMNCAKLELTTLPSSLTTVMQRAFEGCKLIAVSELPNSLQLIGERAFKFCAAMTASTLSTDLKTIGNYAFDECANVAFSQWPAGVTAIGVDAFRKTNVSFNTWPSGITTITDGVFVNALNITEFTIPTEVTTIQKRAFYIAPVAPRTFTSKAATPPTAVDTGTGVLPSFGADETAPALITLKVLRKYEDAYKAAGPWSKMIVSPIAHEITIIVTSAGQATVTSDYEHAEITDNKLTAYEGDPINFTIVPNTNYVVADVQLNSESIKESLAGAALTLSNIEADATLEITLSSAVSIENVEANAVDATIDQANIINITGADSTVKSLFDINGRKLTETTDNLIDASVYNNGVYLLKVGTKTFKLLKK